MDFKEFFDIARKVGGVEYPKEAYKGNRWGMTKAEVRAWENTHMSEAFFGETWTTGGMGGGSCWDDGTEDHHHAISGSIEPPLADLDALLLRVAPNISFLLYRNLENTLLRRGEYSENEYYGNYTEYAFKRIVLLELFDFLREHDVIT